MAMFMGWGWKSTGLRVLAALGLTLSCASAAPASAQTLSVLASAGVLNEPQGIVLDPAGNLYVVASQGYVANRCTVGKIAPDGGMTTLYSVLGTLLGGCDLDGIVLDGAGNLFVAGDGQIVKITPAGTASVFATIGDTTDGLALDAAGNFYVSSTLDDTVYKVTPGGVVQTWVPRSAGLVQPHGLAVDASGNLYIAGAAYDAALKPTPFGTIAKVTPTGQASALVPSSAPFTQATNLAIDKSGNLVASVFGDAIMRIAPDGTITTLAAAPSGAASGMAFDAAGNLLLADPRTDAINRLAPDGTLTRLYGGTFAGPQFAAYDAAGNLYVSNESQSITKVTPAGVASVFIDPPAGGWAPEGLAIDGAGNLYVADAQHGAIDKVAPDATVTSFVASGQGLVQPEGLAFGPDGDLYVADLGQNTVSKVTPAGVLSTVVGQGGIAKPLGLAFDSAGNLYVANGGISRVAPDGTVSPYGSPQNGAYSAQDLAVDGAGNIYASSNNPVGIVKIAPDGSVAMAIENTPGEVPLPLTAPLGLVFDKAGHLVIVDTDSNTVLQASFPPSPLVAAVLPGGRSVAPFQPATVFATMINTGDTDLAECGVQLVPYTKGNLDFSFQTTDPATNALTGVANQPVSIPAQGAQSFALTFVGYGNSALPDEPLGFFCANVTPAPSIVGVNTVSLDFDSNPVPDIIALSATATHDGTLHLAGGTGAFAIATDNAGAAGALGVTADTGAVELPLALALCQTDASGQCLAPPASSLDVTFAAGATPTFSVFATASDTIPFAPASARIFLRFTDASRTTHGSTSVAVTTQ